MDRNLPTFAEGEDHVKISHFTKKGYNISGIVHVGTNDWYELQWYLKMGITHCLGFEPLSEAIERFYQKYQDLPITVDLLEVALGKTKERKMLNVANKDGQSSSFFETTEDYKGEFPDQYYVGQRITPIIRFDSLLEGDPPSIDLSKYDCLVLDVEGMELDVLKGMGQYLRYFKFLNIECSGEPTYIDGPSAEKIIDYVKKFGFVQDSPIEPHNDIMFIRKDVL